MHNCLIVDKIFTASDDTRWTSIVGGRAYPPYYAGHHTTQRKGAEHGGASRNATGARDPMGLTESNTGSGSSGRTTRETQEKQARLADRGSDSGHHCSDRRGRFAVKRGWRRSRTENGENLREIVSLPFRIPP